MTGEAFMNGDCRDCYDLILASIVEDYRAGRISDGEFKERMAKLRYAETGRLKMEQEAQAKAQPLNRPKSFV
jgi:hypothetical protein